MYVLPPLQTLVHEYAESSPYCFKFLDTTTDKIYVHSMIVNKEIYQDFYNNWWNAKTDDQQPTSKIGKKLGVNGLRDINDMWRVKPIGMITRKQDYYGESNEICPGDRFTIQWHYE